MDRVASQPLQRLEACMTYSTHSIVRPIAGRLALDFLNTANWTDDNQVLHEKIETTADLDLWAQTLGLPNALCPSSVETIHEFRSNLRSAFMDPARLINLNLDQYMRDLKGLSGSSTENLRQQPLLGLIAISALSIFSDARELARVKKCPGSDCGWLFLDETKNARRKWCIMETCGNRAKASRNYARRKQT